jgi:serine/threonine-protein kinase
MAAQGTTFAAATLEEHPMPSSSAIDRDEPQLLAACAELSRRLRSGDDCRAEDILSAYPSIASNPEHVLKLVQVEVQTRREMGETLLPDSWFSRFPQYRDQIRSWLDTTQAEARLVGAQPTPTPSLPETNQEAAPVPVPLALPARYRIFEQLAEGGMGRVDRAYDTIFDREVALKRIKKGMEAGAIEVQRFYREARAAAQLEHPHIIPIRDFGQLAGEHYFTMDFAPGGTLASRLELDVPEAVALVEKLARAIQYAHAKGIVHRDLKPSNVLFDKEGEPRVSDFGLAKPVTGDDLTRAGTIVGTDAYMSPEQAAGEPATRQSDVWSLGVILYELLAGRRPFLGKGQQVRDRIRFGEPPAPCSLRPTLDPALEKIVLTCLEKDPTLRYESAEELAEALRGWREGTQPPPQRRHRLRRAWRSLRRLAARNWLALLLLPGLLPLAWSGGAQPAAPADTTAADAARRHQSLQRIEARLKAGKAITLVGPKGLPPWYRFATGDGRTLLRTGDFLGVQAFATTLLELVPDPQQEHYTFSAEIMINSTFEGYAGIYFMAETRPSATGLEIFFYRLSFADRGERKDQVHLDLVRYEAQRADGITVSPIVFMLDQVQLPAGPVPSWRRLEVKVTPAALQASIDGRKLQALTHAHVQHRLPTAVLFKVQPPLQFAPRGGLGLIVEDASAFFRNVTLSPSQPAPPK